MIKFEKVQWKNLLSTGNTPNTIFLNRVASALITGENGSGKSTLLDAISFALFGKPYRNIKKDQLINTVNGKAMEVEITFTVNEVPYRVVRGLKPAKFQIFRKDVEIPHDAAAKDYQKKLEQILGLNQKAFSQIVILGSARYQSFMDLTTADRRGIIEEILDITVFSRMNEVLKSRIQQLDLDVKENNYQKDLCGVSISAATATLQNFHNRTKESAEKVEKERERVKGEMTLLEKRISEIDSEIGKIELVDIEEIREKIHKAKIKETTLTNKVKDIDKKVSYYDNNDVCGECTQTIEESFKQNVVSGLTEEKNKIVSMHPLIEETFNKLNDSFSKAKEVKELYEKATERRKTAVNERNTLNTLLNKLQPETLESDTSSIEQTQNELSALQVKLKQYEQNALQYSETRHYYEACKILLKDSGIKAKIIAQYLPVMNKLINKYLDQMGASYSFHLDEQFNEIIKSRYRDTFSYSSFSEGEKSRIDLALMFTWREIAKLKNSVNTNLLIMDEVGDSSLDGDATDALWDILADLKDANVFVISHKTSNVERFTSHIQFTKNGNFSKIVDSKV